ncbi:MAG TPA: sel1 repeat family protein [Gammaproteobacteria bacterium]|nr:sel1 repeat family protein [Gammaproteobacteria bacterium]
MKHQHILMALIAVSCSLFVGPVHAEKDPLERSLNAYYAGHYNAAYNFTVPLAGQGNPAALNLLGMMYELGRGVPQDPARSVVYYRKAAEKGDIHAQFNLAVSYNTGVGIPMNFQQAVKWYRRAADQGADFAQYNLATMYEEGSGVAQDFQQAAQWYRLAAEHGNPQAQNNLGWLYKRGRGVGKNLMVAYAWLDTAAVQGLHSAAEERDRIAAQLTQNEYAIARSLAEKYRQDYAGGKKK